MYWSWYSIGGGWCTLYVTIWQQICSLSTSLFSPQTCLTDYHEKLFLPYICWSIFLSPNVGNISQRKTMNFYYHHYYCYYYYFDLILLLFLLILLSLLICYHFYLYYLSPTSSKFNCTSHTMIYLKVHTIGGINRPVA